MKSFITNILISLLCSRLAAGVAIPSSPIIEVISPNSTTLEADPDTTHCSRGFASYGHIHPGSVACLLASYDLMQDPKIKNLPSMYPMEFVSSTAALPSGGNGFRTPWRSTYGECTVAIALLSEVPARFTPEVSAGHPGQSTIVIKGTLERRFINLQSCMEPPQGTNIGWAEARSLMEGDGKVGVFTFKKGSPIDLALPDGPRIPRTLSSNLTADLTVE